MITGMTTAGMTTAGMTTAVMISVAQIMTITITMVEAVVEVDEIKRKTKRSEVAEIEVLPVVLIGR